MQKYIVVLCTFFLFSCENKNSIPSGILKPQKMEIVLWDILCADVFAFDFIKKDTLKNPELENVILQQKIFAVHKISKEEFYKSYEFYKAHPNIMQPMLDSLISKATREKYVDTKTKQWNDTTKAQ
ncbi:MAG: hypothetical protein RIS73_165 [Bacteroidota bacterium]|jgi:hypothetical protein